jgi:hypothetical protein
VGLAWLVGCGSEFTDYCDKRNSCYGGNDKDKNACVAEREAEKSEAEAYDCGDAFKAYADCRNTSSSCQNGSFTSGTACNGQSTALSLCKCQASHLGAQGKCSGAAGAAGASGAAGAAGVSGGGGSGGGSTMTCSQCMSACLAQGVPQSTCSAACVPPACK